MQTDWWMALGGGALIGLSAAALMYFHGRIAGISGIFGGLLAPKPDEVSWRLAFVGGLMVGGTALMLAAPSAFVDTTGRDLGYAVAAGLLVGFGTRMGSGCTSGHGVCGISRFSTRSILATVTFIGSGALTVALLGGAS